MTSASNWLSGLGVVIAIAAASIAFFQWTLARTKLVLELFDKRMAFTTGFRKTRKPR
jgi:hypothetical protein